MRLQFHRNLGENEVNYSARLTFHVIKLFSFFFFPFIFFLSLVFEMIADVKLQSKISLQGNKC